MILTKYLSKVKMKYATPEKRAELIKKSKIIKIGDNCSIYDKVSFGSEPYLIKIGNKVRIAKGVNFITHDGGVWVLRNNGMLSNSDIFGKIIIGNNVHIGINAVIMPGVTIGDNVVIGVGTIVTKDIPSNSIVAGVPGRVIRTLDEYYAKQKEKADYTKHMNTYDKKIYLEKKYNILKE